MQYISATNTAKLLRTALRAAFPAVKFSVRQKANSLNVSWMDGPVARDVDAIAELFAGARFDGMVDMEYGVSHWLLPDGTVQLAQSPGTETQRSDHKAVQNPQPHPDAVQVRFLAKYVFTQREASVALMETAFWRVLSSFSPVPDILEYISIDEGSCGQGILSHDPFVPSVNEWLSTLIHRVLVHTPA